MIDEQCKFDARNRAPKAGALGQPRGMGWRWGEGGFRMRCCIPMANLC